MCLKNFIWMLAIAFLLFYSADYDITPSPSTRQISGQVTYVIDGDTFQLSSQQLGDIRIRVAEIDAPEMSQAYGQKSKSYLKRLIQHKPVICSIKEKDKYGRYIAKIRVPGTHNLDVSEEMIRAGYAWHYKKYSTNQELANIERQTKTKRRGLWADQDAVAPWIYRQQQNIK